MFAVAKREFRALFQNVIGWIYLAVVIFVYELYYAAFNMFQGYPYISYAVSSSLFIFLIAIPILSMRVFAEEKRTKTDQLILTAPVSLGKIVFGKFLALAMCHTIVVAVACISPLVLSSFGEVPLGEAYVAIFGLWIYGIACMAICTFVSALTESQVLAAVLGFLALFLGFMMNSITGMLSNGGNWLTKILNCYDLYTPITGFFGGYIDLADTFYFISITALFLFLTHQAINKRRYDTTRKSFSITAFSWGTTVVGIAIIVFMNLLVRDIPTDYTQIDTTSEKLYSITKETQDLLDGLEQDIDIFVIVDEAAADTMVKQTLGKYDEAKHVNVTYINPSKNPVFAEQYVGNAAVYTNSLIVTDGVRSKLVSSQDFYITNYDYETGGSSVSGYDVEGLVTSAICYVISDELPVVYELEGHDETRILGDFKDVIEKKNYEIKQLNFLKEDAVPDDCAALIINGPAADISKDDADKVIAYIKKGGNVLIALNYDMQDKMTNLASVLDVLGFKAVEGLVAENDQNKFYQSPFYLLPYTYSTDATENIYGDVSVFVPYSMAIDDSQRESAQTILITSKDAISKTDYMTAATLDPVEGDTTGELKLGVCDTTDFGGNALIYGSYMLFVDSTNEMVAGRNAVLFSDGISYLTKSAAESVSSVVIPVKDYAVSNLTIAFGTIIFHCVIWLFILPVTLVVAGIVIWAIRRKR